MSGPAHARGTVLAIVPALTTGGAERQLVRLCEALDRRRFRIEVLYYEQAGPFENDLRRLGVPVTALDRHALGAAGLLRALRAEIRRRRPDVLLCRLPSAYRFGRAAALGMGVPVVLAEERTTEVASFARRLIDRALNVGAAGWITNSRRGAEHVVRDLSVPPTRVHVIENGMDVAAFDRARPLPELDGLRRQGKHVVLNLGGLRPVKNQHLFLRVCARLARRHPTAVFALCGDGALRGELERQRDRLGLGERCRFLGARSDVPAVLAATDLLIQTSDHEGLPNAVIEALCAGVPVVATNVGGTSEILTHGRTGLLAPRRDEDALVERASDVLADPALAQALGGRGRSMARRRFDMRLMARRYEALFARLLAARRRGGEACESTS